MKGSRKNSSNKPRRFHDIKEGNCIFPFIFKGKVFNECIPDTKGKKYNGERCATKIDKERNMINWGYCKKTKVINNKRSNKGTNKRSNKGTSKGSDKGSKKKTKKIIKSSIILNSNSKKVDLDKLRLPKWYDNSCFLDSVIVCLLLRDNPYILNRLLEKKLIPYKLKESNSNSINKKCSLEARQKIRNELVNIYNYLRDNISDNKIVDRKSKTDTKFPRRLRNFRESMKECVINTFEDFTDSSQREANEFLKFIFTLFPDKDQENLIETTYYTNDKDTDIKKEEDIKNLNGNKCKSINKLKTDIFYFLSPSDIFTMDDNIKLSEIFKLKDDSTSSVGNNFICPKDNKIYERKIKFSKFNETRYLIFDLSRAIEGMFLDKSIIPDESIILENRNKFRFVSSIYRTPGLGGAHFTSFILVNNKWFYYDDYNNPPTFKEIGNYNNLIKYKNGKINQSVIYFYEPT